MPSLQGVVVCAGQDDSPTGPSRGRAERCRAYRAWSWARGKITRLQGLVVGARKDYPPIGRGRVGARQDAVPTGPGRGRRAG